MPEPTPSYRKLMAKADELRKCDSKLTSPQAFAKAYENPANRDLVQQTSASRLVASLYASTRGKAPQSNRP